MALGKNQVEGPNLGGESFSAATTMKVLWHWISMGPYHFARMNALAARVGLELSVLETTSQDDHGWLRREQPLFSLRTISSSPSSSAVSRAAATQLSRAFVEQQPDVLIASGYFDPFSLEPTLEYRAKNPQTKLLLWSESTALDRPQRRASNAAKKLLIAQFDGALVAGRPHRRYLEDLGMDAARIGIVGNCVDSEFFASQTRELRVHGSPTDPKLPNHYFLYVGRMISVKNLSKLLEAYKIYAARAGQQAWGLVLVGTGPEEASLKRQTEEMALSGVYFAGLKQAADLPQYYAKAACFLLPSVSEPWGLVVNEAMASGLPILASNRCGCAEDLICEGENGFLFNPFDASEIADCMFRVSSTPNVARVFGERSVSLIQEYSPEKFAERVQSHIQRIVEMPPAHQSRPVAPVQAAAARFLAKAWGHVGQR
ncbi:MAG: glycosyltransferase family 4 protein [Bryobacteraceae bacterium]